MPKNKSLTPIERHVKNGLVIALCEYGIPQKSVAHIMNMTQSQVSRIVKAR